ncbi:helix-turn-helix transcriptional regulator [Novosphingobium sp. KACC 22771]|uniref:helix-turn-helix transcriptional regulator n=1 Tax=Novosphingobium sp. KACC 22771 TaxID=3025670 RepID=UPI002366F3FA|nr:AlpA family transcriptional regulator [Novosphingobium sp. KACC 22771]WDF71503.1 AlpA family transcriptional regulator [Novosphingobium sp. KACC 22771]
MSDNGDLHFLRMPDVVRRTGMSRATVYRRIGAGEFPRPRQLSLNAVGWLDHEITEWIISRPPVHT